jgi:hypothetical protein
MSDLRRYLLVVAVDEADANDKIAKIELLQDGKIIQTDELKGLRSVAD